MKNIILTILGGLLLISCGTNPIRIEPFSELVISPGMYRIYAYYSCDGAPISGPDLYINNKMVAALLANTFYSGYVSEGPIEVVVKWDAFTKNLKIKPPAIGDSDEIYIKYWHERDPANSRVYYQILSQVSTEQGKKEIQRCRRATRSLYSRELSK